MSATQDVSALREMIAGLDAGPRPAGATFFDLGAPGVDGTLGGPLACAALHEIYAAREGDVAAAAGFTLALAKRAADARSPARPLLWIRQDFLDAETGRLAAAGLASLGISPDQLLLVRAPGAEMALRVAEDAARCPSLGAVLIELWGEAKVLDLTATRRLSLRADGSGVPVFLLRASAHPTPSVAITRWRVEAAPSRPLPGEAPGAPAFLVSLLRHRAGLPGRCWHLEWDHETGSFHDIVPLSRPVVPIPAGREAGPAAALPLRRAG